MNNNNNNNNKSPFEQAYEKTVNKLAQDMPLLLHGSGDVPPSEVSGDTCQILSALTAQYIANLVDAALDAQEMLCDGAAVIPTSLTAVGKRKRHETNHLHQNRAIVPPVAFPHSRKPPRPPPVPPAAVLAAEKEQGIKRKVRREKDEYWDEPLPEPKIRKKSTTDATTTTTTAASAASSSVGAAAAAAAAAAAKNDVLDEDGGVSAVIKVPVDEWVGVAGVDLFETSRARSAYVRGPYSLTTQNFIFPVCHDVYAYGRVLEAQKLKRQTQPLLMDPVVMEMVRTEGRQRMHHHRHKKMQQDKKKREGGGGKSATSGGGGGVSDPEDEDEDDDDDNESEGDDGPMWPGLEFILPVHRSS